LFHQIPLLIEQPGCEPKEILATAGFFFWLILLENKSKGKQL